MKKIRTIKLKTPLTEKEIKLLKAKDRVELSGSIYTARDRAHKKLINLIKKNKKLPLKLKDAIIYYCGPTFCKGKIGACGPTTSLRMDSFIEPLMQKGLKATIGKGKRSPFARNTIKKYKGIYFVTYAGCAAYLSNFVKDYKICAFPELNAEAIYELKVENFPLIIAIDSYGKDIYSRL